MTDGIFVVDNFIPREDVRAVREEIEKVSLKLTVQAKSIRTDKVSWVSEHFNGPLGQCVKTMKGIGSCFEDVLGKLEAPSRCMVAAYEQPGGVSAAEKLNGYRTHLDHQPPADDDLYWLWKSSREQSERKLTSILYLNDETWDSDQLEGHGNGGNLRCYLNCNEGDDSGKTATGTKDIAPIGGRLVVFLSRKIPHEVLPTRSGKRVALSCWHIGSSNPS